MNKLISRDSIQRFKEGRKIVKAQGGTKWWESIPFFGDAINNTIDAYNKEIQARKLAKKRRQDWFAQNYLNEVSSKYDDNGNLIRTSVGSNKGHSIGNQYSNSDKKDQVSVASLNKDQNVESNSTFQQNKPANNIFIKGFQNRKGEIKDVRAMQKKLMELGLLKDKFGADGKWGKNTEAAYQKYLTIKNIPEYTPFEHISPAEQMGIPTSEENVPLYQRIRFKQGGQLSSRNPVERFKQGKKIVKAQQGKTLPTAPSVKERYFGGYRYQIPWMKKVRGPKTSMLVHPGEIQQYVKEVTPYYNDTTYVEVPEHTSFVNIKPRVASTNSTEDLNSPILDKNGWPTGHYKFKFNNSPEYEILKRRFNTAWSLAK